MNRTSPETFPECIELATSNLNQPTKVPAYSNELSNFLQDIRFDNEYSIMHDTIQQR